MIEILGPLDDGSPIIGHLERGGGPYHFCFAVHKIDQAVNEAVRAGASVIVAPVADVAFEGRQIAFILHPNHGLIELVQSPEPGGWICGDPSMGRVREGHTNVRPVGFVHRALAALCPGVGSQPSCRHLLRSSGDAVGDVPAQRWTLPQENYAVLTAQQRACVQYGGFVPRASKFDHSCFGMLHAEACAIDPQQRLLLHVGYGALHSARYSD